MANIGVGTGISLLVNNGLQGATVSASGNITGGNVLTSGLIATTSNIAAGNIAVARAATVGGDVTVNGRMSVAGNIASNGLVSAPFINAGTFNAISANITGTLSVGNLALGSNISGINITASGAVTATGNITSSGNIAAGNISVGVVRTNAVVSQGPVSGTALSATGNITGAAVSVTGNVAAANFLTPTGSPYQSPGGPAFIATITTPQNLSTSPSSITQLSLIFNNVSKNINSGYNPANGIFTAPKEGFYQVSAACALTPSNVSQVINYYGQAVLGVYKNGTPVAAGGFIDARGAIINGVAIGAFSASSISPVVYLNVGDTLQCKLAYVTNAPSNFWNTYANVIQNYFQACWLRGA